MIAPAFAFEVTGVEETHGEADGDHQAILHGGLVAGDAREARAGTPVRVPSDQGPLAARVVALAGDHRLVLHRPAPPRPLVSLISPGRVEACTEAQYDAMLLDMLTDDRVRAIMHDRPSGPDHGHPEAFAPPACGCIEVLRGRDGATDILRAMLRSWEPENVSGAVQALGFFGPEVFLPLLPRMLRHNVARVRYRVALVLAPHRDHPAVAEAWSSLWADPDPRLRRLAAEL